MVEKGLIIIAIVLCICLFLLFLTLSYMLLGHIVDKVMEYWFYRFDRVTTNEAVFNKQFYKNIGIKVDKTTAKIEGTPFLQEDILFEFNDICISNYRIVKLISKQDGPWIWKRRWDREYVSSSGLYYDRPDGSFITIVTSDRNLLNEVEMLMFRKTPFTISVLDPDGSTRIRVNDVVITKEVFDGNIHYITGDFCTYLNTKI